METTIEVRSLTFDGRVRKSWEAEILARDGNLFVLRGIFADSLKHPFLGVIEAGTISYEYYWLDRWYNVFRFHHPDGRFRNYYCNINMPPRFNGTVLDYVDLDIDIIADDVGNYNVLDCDEYVLRAEQYAYPDEVRVKVEKTIAQLKEVIVKSEFPFDLMEQRAL